MATEIKIPGTCEWREDREVRVAITKCFEWLSAINRTSIDLPCTQQLLSRDIYEARNATYYASALVSRQKTRHRHHVGQGVMLTLRGLKTSGRCSWADRDLQTRNFEFLAGKNMSHHQGTNKIEKQKFELLPQRSIDSTSPLDSIQRNRAQNVDERGPSY